METDGWKTMQPHQQEFYDFFYGPTKLKLSMIWVLIDDLNGVEIPRKRVIQLLEKIEFIVKEELRTPVEIRYKEDCESIRKAKEGKRWWHE